MADHEVRTDVRRDENRPTTPEERRWPRRRQEWFDDQLDLDPARLVFIDDEGGGFPMTVRHAGPQALAAERSSVPPGHVRGGPGLAAGQRSATGCRSPLPRRGPRAQSAAPRE